MHKKIKKVNISYLGRKIIVKVCKRYLDIVDILDNGAVFTCEDCGLGYRDFCLDTILTNEQWIMVHPESTEGLLCANCIVKRASFLDGIICTKIILKKKEDYPEPDVDGDGSLGCPEYLEVTEVIIEENFYGFCKTTNQSESLITYDNSN